MLFGLDNNQTKMSCLTSLTDTDLNEITRIQHVLNPDEKILIVARQSRIKPGGSMLTPNVVYATDKRVILRSSYLLGIKECIGDIPYDTITSVKLEKGLLSCTIRFKAPELMSSTRLGIIDGLIDGENDQDGMLEGIAKDKAEKIFEIIRDHIESKDRMNKIERKNHSPGQQDIQTLTTSTIAMNCSISCADELAKLAKLKEQRVLTEEEFLQMKEDVIRRSKI